jgi:hypothetical protein
MSTPYWWLLANLQRYTDSSIFFMTGGLGTNPHLPGTTGILGNCTAPSNTRRVLHCWCSSCCLFCSCCRRLLRAYSFHSTARGCSGQCPLLYFNVASFCCSRGTLFVVPVSTSLLSLLALSLVEDKLWRCLALLSGR